MNWSKSKTILIMALIFTNIFLLGSYISLHFQTTGTSVAEDTATVDFLRRSNIYVYDEIPTKIFSLPVLEVEVENVSQDQINEMISQFRIPFPSEVTRDNLLNYVELFLNENNLLEETAILDKITSLGSSYILEYRNKETEKEMFVEESYIICFIENKKIKSVEKKWIKPIKYGSKNQSTIPATTALLKFMSEYDETSAVSITNIEMVYWLDSSYTSEKATSFDTAFPAWEITYNNEKKKYILAY